MEQISTTELRKVAKEIVAQQGQVGDSLKREYRLSLAKFRNRCGRSADTLEGKAAFREAFRGGFQGSLQGSAGGNVLRGVL